MVVDNTVLGLVIVYVGSVTLPVLSFAVHSSLKLQDLYKECASRVQLVLGARAPPPGVSLDSFCRARSFNCDEVRDEGVFVLKLVIVASVYGLLYFLAAASETRSPTGITILFATASAFPVVALYIAMERATRIAGAVGMVIGFVEEYYSERDKHAASR